jgi:hypothetical protein
VSSPGRESRSSYSTLRLLVQPVAEAQGKGGVVADGLVLVKEYPPGVEHVNIMVAAGGIYPHV